MNQSSLDHAGIAARIPHSGSMCLLHSMSQHSAQRISCSAISHLDPNNPLRHAHVLWSATAIEYAAQAMALHGALNEEQAATTRSENLPQIGDHDSNAAGKAGYLASVRAVRLCVPRLDTIPGPLKVQAWLMAGDARQAIYGFSLHDQNDDLVADGRATVVMGFEVGKVSAR